MRRLVLCAALLAGCVSGAERVKLQDGSDGFTVWCKSEMVCYSEAGKACATGYDVLERSASSQPYVAAAGGGVAAGVNSNYGLLIRCR